MFTVSIDPH